MDATYKDTAIAQVAYNTAIDYEMKQSIIDVINKMDEGAIKNLTKDDRNRFFYNSSRSDVEQALKNNMPQGMKSRMQATANRLARQGKMSDNTFIRDNFSTTYTRGGHKYVDGKRLY